MEELKSPITKSLKNPEIYFDKTEIQKEKISRNLDQE